MSDSLEEQQRTFYQGLQKARSNAAKLNNNNNSLRKRSRDDDVEREIAKISKSSVSVGQNNGCEESVNISVLPKTNCNVIKVPNSKVGLIIGKGGETIKRLQEETGTQINVENGDPNSLGVKEVRISGDPVKIEVARNLILKIIDKKEYNGGNSLDVVVTVPQQAVGLVIGKGGAMITKLQAESGAKIQFRQFHDQTPGDRLCYISGSEQNIEKARAQIQNLIKSVRPAEQNQTGNTNEFGFTVPASKCGIIIGKGGENIKNIIKYSGAHCELDHSYKGEDRAFIIRGSEEQIEHARKAINKKIHMNINLVPRFYLNQPQTYPGVAMDYYPSWAMPSYEQQWGACTSSQTGQMDLALQWAQWAHYNLNQVEMQPQNQIHGTVANTIPAASNQANDYSEEWANYYHSMGQHEEAYAVEYLIKTATTKQ